MTPRRTKASLLTMPAVIIAMLLPLFSDTAQASPCESEPTDMSVAYGDQITCPISAGGDTDLFRFSGVAGDRVLAEAVEVGVAGFGPRIRVLAPNGTQLGDTYSPARLDLILPQTGIYTAIVYDANSFYAGDYAFAVSCLSGTCLATPPPPPHPAPERSVVCEPEPTDMFPFFGTRVVCDITQGDTDLYRFEARAGDRVLAEAVEVNNTGFSPRIRLVAPDGTQLLDTYSPARFENVLPQTGTYTAIVYDANSFYEGDYAFTVSCTGGPCLSLRSVPTVSLSLTGCTVCAPGNPLSVDVHWQNLGPTRVTEVKVGLRLPDGTPINLFGDKHLEYSFPAGFDLSTALFSFPWPSGLPSGDYTVEATLIGPDLGDTFSRDVQVFKVP